MWFFFSLAESVQNNKTSAAEGVIIFIKGASTQSIYRTQPLTDNNKIQHISTQIYHIHINALS